MLRPLALIIALAALASLPAAALADWPNTPGVQLPIAVGPANITSNASVADGAGGAIFIWSDNRTGNDDIYGQRVNSLGVAQWGTGLLLAGGAGNQNGVCVARDGVGGVLIAYADNAAGTGNDLRVLHINAAGAVTWGPYTLYNGAGDQTPIGVALLTTGNYAICVGNNASGNNDLYSILLFGNGSAYYPAAPICNAAGDQYGLPPVADRSGGMYYVWDDFRPSGGNNIFAQHFTSTNGASWTANGLSISTSGNGNNGVLAAPDSLGNVTIVWNDFDGSHRQLAMNTRDVNGNDAGTGAISLTSGASANYVSSLIPDGQGGQYVAYSSYPTSLGIATVVRITSAGLPYWSPRTFIANLDSEYPVLAPDPDGGVFVAWLEAGAVPASGYDIDVQELNQDGGTVGYYVPTVLSNGVNNDQQPIMVADGRGGAIALWLDPRLYFSGNLWDLYAGRVAPFAQLGNPEPKLAGIKDVPNDQGGHLTVRWNKSYLDRATDQVVTSYWIWRQLPTSVAQTALSNGAKLLVENDSPGRAGTTPRKTPAAGERLIRRANAAASPGYWEYVGQQTAQGFASYSFVVSTGGDSVAASNPRTSFMVEAYSYYGHWESQPDSGYSVDNLPPVAPAPFTGQYSPSVTHLHWNPNHEADLAGYRLYRGSSTTFATDGAHFVASPVDTGYAASSGPYIYKLTAIDVHGNESVAAVLIPTGTLSAPEPIGLPLTLARPWPNPARDGVTLRFALPQAARARLAVHDAQGRLVRVLADGDQPAGELTITWDRRNDRGDRVGAGLYFLRLETGGRVLTERFVALD
jgi:FlgD Ig-like domain